MRKEEASSGIVWISISITVLVMQSKTEKYSINKMLNVNCKILINN